MKFPAIANFCAEHLEKLPHLEASNITHFAIVVGIVSRWAVPSGQIATLLLQIWPVTQGQSCAGETDVDKKISNQLFYQFLLPPYHFPSQDIHLVFVTSVCLFLPCEQKKSIGSSYVYYSSVGQWEEKGHEIQIISHLITINPRANWPTRHSRVDLPSRRRAVSGYSCIYILSSISHIAE